MKVIVRQEEDVKRFICPGCAATLIEPGRSLPAALPCVCGHCGEELDWTEVEHDNNE